MLFPFDLNLPGLALENDIFHLAAFGFFLGAVCRCMKHGQLGSVTSI